MTDEAILKIKEMILSGELKPGDRLPPEKELGEALGLSRSSLREAVKALEIIRVLDVRRGDGTYVTSLSPSLLLDALSFVVDVHQDDSVLELFEVRRILEPAAAALATPAITAADIAHLRDLLAEVARHDLGGRAGGQRHRLPPLHQRAVRQRLPHPAAGRLSSSTLRARVWRGLTQEGSVERTLTEHRAIVDALEAGDADLVAAR